MSTSFASLKKGRAASLKAMTSMMEKQDSKASYGDDRIFTLTKDKTGIGMAVVRFLPIRHEEPAPFVRRFNHGWKNAGGKWFIENCPTTNGNECPVCESNSVYWNKGDKANQEVARTRKRKLSYYSNILVIKDFGNPENNGKVFLYRYGKKIYDKLSIAITPEFADEKSIDPFNMWNSEDCPPGADFTIKVKKVEGWDNYDSSSFGEPSDLGSSDKEREALYMQTYDLGEFVAEKEFMDYGKMTAKLNKFLGVTTQVQSMDADEADSADAASPDTGDSQDPGISAEAAEIDDDLERFKKLAMEG